ncbi:hypothetical protein GMST_01020 [Geomonas silvestris]|uniref:Uncharacterized protein n=1 Tax=Geomonas silvestris TaxID=2740184 RepID=A0A6V8MCU6_9BACT|nr:hypothetical protein [Geomonas silvestris]GFO57777.1 hypothetical protein GMST_01020 [Geomonas silvestris]
MLRKALATVNWLPHYLAREARRSLSGDKSVRPREVYFCICDHFEPYWNNADRTTARKRIARWLDCYPRIADRYRDCAGNVLKYSFFYPEEEYQAEDLDALAGLCHAGYGEVEIHLHHDNDSAENLRRTLLDYKKRLHERHGLLSIDKNSGDIVYGFIHGNWALCNSRPDGRWCGVNEEIRILLETGCYADFTMPSAPCTTQTRKVNSLYYALDRPGRPRSHDSGIDLAVGRSGQGLLMVQGPLCFNWQQRKFGVLPRLENSGLLPNLPPSRDRVRRWVETGVSVAHAPERVFVKLYTHGTQEQVMRMLFDAGGLACLLEEAAGFGAELGAEIYFVSAREMVERIVETARQRGDAGSEGQ